MRTYDAVIFARSIPFLNAPICLRSGGPPQPRTIQGHRPTLVNSPSAYTVPNSLAWRIEIDSNNQFRAWNAASRGYLRMFDQSGGLDAAGAPEDKGSLWALNGGTPYGTFIRLVNSNYFWGPGGIGYLTCVTIPTYLGDLAGDLRCFRYTPRNDPETPGDPNCEWQLDPYHPPQT